MFDRRERSGDLLAALLAVKEGFSSDLWVALPGVIQAFDAAKRTCVIQPTIKFQVQDDSGAFRWEAMPLLLDCPVVFPGGGGVSITFPLAQGDECLVIFADRCIDAWHQSGGIGVQAELRMHDLSDGFCIPGPRSLPAVEPSISTTEAQMRSQDGTVFAAIDPVAGTSRLVAAGSEIKASAGRVDLNGELWINGARYLDHVHTNVTTGTNNSGGVA